MVESGFTFCGQTFSQADLELICGITRDFSRLSLTELSKTICELRIPVKLATDSGLKLATPERSDVGVL
jgi:hypothetical protein